MICLKKASTKSTLDRKGEASCLGTSKLLLVKGELDVVEGIGDLHIAVVDIGDLLLLDSKVDCSGRSGKTIKEIKQGEYLVYPRDLRPLLSIMHCINGKKRLYIVDWKTEIQSKGKKLGLTKTSIFRRVLQHEERIANSLYKA